MSFVPGTSGFDYNFGDGYSEDDNPFNLINSPGGNREFHASERLNQRVRVLIAGYDVTKDVASLSINNSLESGLVANISLINPRNRYVVTREDKDVLIEATKGGDSSKRVGNKDILGTYDGNKNPFSLKYDGDNNTLLYNREVNSVSQFDGVGESYSKYEDYLFKHMLFIVKWHSGIRKEEHDFIFDYKEPVIIFLQGRFSTMWYFGFTGFITKYNYSQQYTSDRTIAINCESRRHQLRQFTRVTNPALVQEVSGLNNQSLGQDVSKNTAFQEVMTGKRIEEIFPVLLLNQTSGKEPTVYPEMPINHLVDPSLKTRTWVDFFRKYLAQENNRINYTIRDPKGVKKDVSEYFRGAYSNLKGLFLRLIKQTGGIQSSSTTNISENLLYSYNINTRNIYNDIDNYIDKEIYPEVAPTEGNENEFFTNRANLDDPLNDVFSTILGDNIYQSYVFTVKPYTTKNISNLLDSNLIRFWETDFSYRKDDCRWRVAKSAGCVGIHPAFHEDFINTFNILPKIFDIVINRLQESKRVIKPGKDAKKEKKTFIFAYGEEALRFNISNYTLANPAKAYEAFKTVRSQGFSLPEFIDKFGDKIQKITVVGHASAEFPPVRQGEGSARFYAIKNLNLNLSQKRSKLLAAYLKGNPEDDKDINRTERPPPLSPTPELAKIEQGIMDESGNGPSSDPWGTKIRAKSALANIQPFETLLSSEGKKNMSNLVSKIDQVSFGWSVPAPSNVADSELANLFLNESISDSTAIYRQLLNTDGAGVNEVGDRTTYMGAVNSEPNIEEMIPGNSIRVSRNADGDITRINGQNYNAKNVIANRRVEIYVDAPEVELEVVPAEEEESIEGICIELGDRTPYDKLKEQVFGVPTETSKNVTGLNFHRPRFIVIFPPLYLGNNSPFAAAFRNFTLEKNEYQSLYHTIDSIIKNIQFSCVETPMGDVILEPINYDFSPWEQIPCYNPKEWGEYSSEGEHNVTVGNFARQSNKIPYAKIFPTYLSNFFKPSDEDVLNKYSVQLPLVKIDQSSRNPYHFNKLNTVNTTYTFDAEKVITRITVEGNPEASDVAGSAFLQNIKASDSMTFLARIGQNSGIRSNVFSRNQFLPIGEYVADGFEDLIRNFEIETISSRASLAVNGAADLAATAIVNNDSTLFTKILTGSDGWFTQTSVQTDYGSTLSSFMKIIIPFIRKVADEVNKKQASNSKYTPVRIDTNLTEETIAFCARSIPSLSKLSSNFPSTVISNKRYYLFEYPLYSTGKFKQNRAGQLQSFVPPYKFSDKDLSELSPKQQAEKKSQYESSSVSTMEAGFKRVLFECMVFLLENSDKGIELKNQVIKALTDNAESRKLASSSSDTSSSSSDSSSFVKNRIGMARKIFTYADLSRLRILGVYNPAADFIRLYGVKEAPIIRVQYLNSSADCIVYAMALFNQIFNEVYGYSLQGIPSTPELLINRTGYFNEINSLGLIKSTSVTISPNESSEMSVNTSYIRRNILSKPKGTRTYKDLLGKSLGTFVDSYSIIDFPVKDDFSEDSVKSLYESQVNAPTYSCFKKLGTLFDSLSEREAQRVLEEGPTGGSDNAPGSAGELDNRSKLEKLHSQYELLLAYLGELTPAFDEKIAEYNDYLSSYKRYERQLGLLEENSEAIDTQLLLVDELAVEEEETLNSLRLQVSDTQLLIDKNFEDQKKVSDTITARTEEFLANGQDYRRTPEYFQNEALLSDLSSEGELLRSQEQNLSSLVEASEIRINDLLERSIELENAKKEISNGLDLTDSQKQTSINGVKASIKGLAPVVNTSYQDLMSLYRTFVSLVSVMYGIIYNTDVSKDSKYKSLSGDSSSDVFLFTGDPRVVEDFVFRYSTIKYRNPDLIPLRYHFDYWESVKKGRDREGNKKALETLASYEESMIKILGSVEDTTGSDPSLRELTNDNPIILSIYETAFIEREASLEDTN